MTERKFTGKMASPDPQEHYLHNKQVNYFIYFSVCLATNVTRVFYKNNRAPIIIASRKRTRI